MKKVFLIFLVLLMALLIVAKGPLILQSDFGTKENAVAAMKGVAYSVDNNLRIFDLSHNITPFDIWEGAQVIVGVVPYWPAGTVFVSVIDPGVGTERKSIVLKTKTGHYFVTPDNGTLTLVAEEYGIEEVRVIDEEVNRLPGSERSYTFHGRDVYAYTGARLASGEISFMEIGPVLDIPIIMIEYERARLLDENTVVGMIAKLDDPYGNIWTNIPIEVFDELGLNVEDSEILHVEISQSGELIYEGEIPYVYSFGYVPEGDPLIYLNSSATIALAINWGNFSETYGVYPGPEWSIKIQK